MPIAPDCFVPPTRAEPTPAGCDLWPVALAARENTDAFSELTTATIRTVFKFVYWKVGANRTVAEEITADVYVAAWTAIDRLRPVADSPTAWLLTIARNKVLSHFRAARRNRTTPVGHGLDLIPFRPLATVEAAAPHLDDLSISRQQARELWRQVQRLSADQYEVLRCRYWLGLNPAETAAAMGRSIAAVRSLQHRAVRTLHHRLRGTALDPAVDTLAAAA